MFTDVTVSFWAVVAAAFVASGLGPLWYGQYLFGEQWTKLAGKRAADEFSAKGVYMTVVAAWLIVAYVLAHFIELIGAFSWQSGLISGFWAGIGFVAASHLVNGAFLGRSNKLYLIDVGYQVIALMLMGAILGGWQ